MLRNDPHTSQSVLVVEQVRIFSDIGRCVPDSEQRKTLRKSSHFLLPHARVISSPRRSNQCSWHQEYVWLSSTQAILHGSKDQCLLLRCIESWCKITKIASILVCFQHTVEFRDGKIVPLVSGNENFERCCFSLYEVRTVHRFDVIIIRWTEVFFKVKIGK